MDEITNIFKDVSFQDANWIYLVPVALMCIDILTGVVNAWKTGHLKSYRMREGLGRKGGEIAILAVGHLFTVGTNMPAYVLTIFSLYIILMELVSICENLKKIGIPIPKFIDKALASMTDTIQNGSKKEIDKEVKSNGGDGERKN